MRNSTLSGLGNSPAQRLETRPQRVPTHLVDAGLLAVDHVVSQLSRASPLLSIPDPRLAGAKHLAGTAVASLRCVGGSRRNAASTQTPPCTQPEKNVTLRITYNQPPPSYITVMCEQRRDPAERLRLGQLCCLLSCRWPRRHRPVAHIVGTGVARHDDVRHVLEVVVVVPVVTQVREENQQRVREGPPGAGGPFDAPAARCSGSSIWTMSTTKRCEWRAAHRKARSARSAPPPRTKRIGQGKPEPHGGRWETEWMVKAQSAHHHAWVGGSDSQERHQHCHRLALASVLESLNGRLRLTGECSVTVHRSE